MSNPLVQHQIGTVVFIIVQLAIALSNMKALRRLGDDEHPPVDPRVSVLVPARNEEHNIGPCVRSLLDQQYPDYELIVLDDNSTDRTGEILSELQLMDSNLRIVQGERLPAGWTGKNWACNHLAQEADGELLLFVDADTTLHRRAIQDAVAYLEYDDADLVTAIPRQEMGTWAERLVIPIMPWSIFTLLPLAIANRVRIPVLSAAIGQFMLFRRTVYEQIDGHNSVRQSPVEDIALARRVKSRGFRWRITDGTNRVHCRMYDTPREVMDGISRTLFAVFNSSIVLSFFVWLWLFIVYLEPFGLLTAAAAQVSLPAGSIWLAVLSICLALVLWGIIYHRFQMPTYLAFLYPFTILATVVIAFRSMYLSLTGRGSWKGRSVAVSR